MVRTVRLGFSNNPFESLEETFKFFDSDNSGHITRTEFIEAMDRLDHIHDAEEVEDMLKSMDLDGDGMINFAEFSLAMSHINFDEEANGATNNIQTSPQLKRKWGDSRTSELDARSKSLTLAAIETAAELPEDEYRGKLGDTNDHTVEGEHYFWRSSGEDQGSNTNEGDSRGPGRTTPIIRRNLLSMTNEGQSIKNFIAKEPEIRLSQERSPERTSLKRDEISWAISLDATELDYLERRAEAVGLHRMPDLEYGFVSKDVAGPVQRYGTSYNFGTGPSKLMGEPSPNKSGIVEIDEEQEWFQQPSTEGITSVSMEARGQMGVTEDTGFQKKVPKKVESIYEKQYSWSPSGPRSIRKELSERRKDRQENTRRSKQAIESPLIREAVIDDPNNVKSREFPVVLDWAYLSEGHDPLLSQNKKNKGEVWMKTKDKEIVSNKGKETKRSEAEIKKKL